VLQGSFFVISVFLQQERGYSAIQTGLTLVPATVGIVLSSGMAQRMASRHPQRLLIRAGFTVTVVGIALLLLLAREDSANWTFWPGLFLMGFGVGTMLTASVNVVQSAWPEDVQGDISGVSRSVSNLGSSLGVAVAGSVLVAATAAGSAPFLTAIVVVGAFAVVGWVAALLLPHAPHPAHRAPTAG
jgi:predicted MFS family arabinose efflux permease